MAKRGTSSFTHNENGISLDIDETAAIRSLMRLAKKWPYSLILFGGAGQSISVRKRASDGSYFVDREVAHVAIPSDGGDGGDRS